MNMRAVSAAFVLFMSSPCVAGDALDSMKLLKATDLAKALSPATGVPEVTVLSDIVTKSFPNRIESGLNTPSDGIVAPGLAGQQSAGTIADILARGYSARPIEIDPRFQKNLERLGLGLELDNLTKISQGIAPSEILACAGDTACSSTKVIKIPGVTDTLTFEFGEKAIRSQDLAVKSIVDNDTNAADRSYGGIPVPKPDIYPESVAIVGNSKLCSGVLVSDDTVITAGHCLCDGVADQVVVGTSILDRDSKLIDVDKTRSVSFVSCDILKSDIKKGDIALLKLNSKVKVSPRAIGNITAVRNAASVRAVGFGRTPSLIGFKYQVNIIIASPQCDGAYLSQIPDEQAYQCAKHFELVAAGLNRDTCSGDSGGPIYVFGDDNKPYVVGVTSRSVTPTGDCGPGGIYVLLNAPPIQDWLKGHGIVAQ